MFRLCLLISSLYVVLSQPLTPKKVLAVHFPAPHSDLSSSMGYIKTELSSRIANLISQPIESIHFGNLTDSEKGGSHIPFTLVDSAINVTDSISTPEMYMKYSMIWKEALASNTKVNLPLTHEKKEIKLDSSKYEFVYDVGYCNSHCTLIKTMTDRTRVMQLRLKDINVSDYAMSWMHLDTLVDGIGRVASSILSVPKDNIIVYSIKPGSVIAQFTVYPSANVDQLNDKWAMAVKDKNSMLSDAFKDMDFSYPAVADTKTTESKNESEGPEAAGTSNAVVAGVVLGSLAGVAVIGGGTAAVVYKRNQRKNASNGVQKQSRDFGAVSPGAGSPNALSDVNIHGEVTPRPTNSVRR